MNLPDDLTALLRAYTDQLKDDPTVLTLAPADVGDRASIWPDAEHKTLDAGFDPTRALVFDRRYRLAIVIDSPRAIGRTKTRELLARLRNVGAHGVLAAFANGQGGARDNMPAWSIADFLGLGFRRAEQARTLQCPYWLYRYNIYDYKITPDWLNARYWANPKRWERERW